MAVLEGTIISAGAGSESVVLASRTSLFGAFQGSDDDTRLCTCNALLGLFETSIGNDRVLLPLLEVLAFLLDTEALQRAAPRSFK